MPPKFSMDYRAFFLCILLCLLGQPSWAQEWIRGSRGQLRWGLQGGLQFGIYPQSESGHGKGGPRGLLRMWAPVGEGNRYTLVTFVAIEPRSQGGARGFSELEPSHRDGKRGKEIWVDDPEGQVRRLAPGVEELVVLLHLERFANGAHISLRISQRSDRPEELRLEPVTEAGGAPLDSCVLTATWGNLSRCRELWLRDGPLTTRELYPSFAGNGFAPDRRFPLKDFLQRPDGPLVALRSDEVHPESVHPVSGSNKWHFGGGRVTQYWRQEKNKVRPDVRVRVNARAVYWASKQAIPGGVSFENFEIQEGWFPGQAFIFGVTHRTPRELGWK